VFFWDYTNILVVVTPRTNLGLGSIATEASGLYLGILHNLSDLTNVSDARSNLGLGNVATSGTDAFLNTALNLSDIPNAGTARTNLGLGSIATLPSGEFLGRLHNLSDLENVVMARSNLGLGNVATSGTDAFLNTANNLSDLPDVPTARTNLGLGTMATQAANSVAITGGTITGMSNPTSDTDVANKNYVDLSTAASGIFSKNSVMNADFNVWQRETNFSTVSTNTNQADRWKTFFNSDTLIFDINRSTNVPALQFLLLLAHCQSYFSHFILH